MKGQRRQFGGARRAARIKDENKKLSGFGSMWDSGDTIWVFYPINKFQDENGDSYLDIVVGGEYGYKVTKEFGLKNKFFIPAFGEKDEEGKPLNLGFCDRMASLAGLIKLGRKQREINDLRAKNIPDPDILQESLVDIENKYKEKQEYQSVFKPMSYIAPTECVVVKTKNGAPYVEEGSVALVSQDLSGDRIRILGGVIDSADYGITEDSKYIEVKYTFKSTGKKMKDGDVDPVGVTPENSMAVKYPEVFEKVKSYLNSLPEDGEMINKRNFNFIPVEEAKVQQACQKYLLLNSQNLDSLSKDEDVSKLVRLHDALDFFKVPISNEKYQKKLKEFLAKEEKEKQEEAEIQEAANQDIETAVPMSMEAVIAGAAMQHEHSVDNLSDNLGAIVEE